MDKTTVDKTTVDKTTEGRWLCLLDSSGDEFSYRLLGQLAKNPYGNSYSLIFPIAEGYPESILDKAVGFEIRTEKIGGRLFYRDERSAALDNQNRALSIRLPTIGYAGSN